MLRFERLTAAGPGPRRGRLTLDHGTVEPPAFMPVGTAGTVKAARWSDLEAAGAVFIALALLAWGAMQQPYFETTIGTLRRVRPELEIPRPRRVGSGESL